MTLTYIPSLSLLYPYPQPQHSSHTELLSVPRIQSSLSCYKVFTHCALSTWDAHFSPIHLINASFWALCTCHFLREAILMKSDLSIVGAKLCVCLHHGYNLHLILRLYDFEIIWLISLSYQTISFIRADSWLFLLSILFLASSLEFEYMVSS